MHADRSCHRGDCDSLPLQPDLGPVHLHRHLHALDHDRTPRLPRRLQCPGFLHSLPFFSPPFICPCVSFYTCAASAANTAAVQLQYSCNTAQYCAIQRQDLFQSLPSFFLPACFRVVLRQLQGHTMPRSRSPPRSPGSPSSPPGSPRSSPFSPPLLPLFFILLPLFFIYPYGTARRAPQTPTRLKPTTLPRLLPYFSFFHLLRPMPGRLRVRALLCGIFFKGLGFRVLSLGFFSAVFSSRV